ncbi:pilus assembly protein TadE [Serinicoccus chungangensis]|uniref:Pilus assembly protein TadE n=1 Tax=Serinicoccus chungangensis TaxID=767452 RepID=A0A0W8IGZ7_9MICO|nr:TadE/TadG family type IV pilus assembly protein [Serinicoccus chungangensis]KUG59252.1 pilus assembly protein TadE [Serinicoccus chungangensis]
MVGGSAERGAAAAEFALLAGLVSVLMLAVVQLAFGLHLHNTATAHVVEGARAGARADATPADGARRAQELLSSSLTGGGPGVTVSARRTVVDGVAVVEVSATMPLPIVGPLGPGESMTVVGHAYAEDQ